jgi:hypothetical protein
MPATRQGAVHSASVVGDVLRILKTRWRQYDGCEGQVRSIGHFLSESLIVVSKLATLTWTNG